MMAAVRKITAGEKIQYISALNAMGEADMCDTIVKLWVSKATGKNPIELPDMILMDTSDSLFQLYREKLERNPEAIVKGHEQLFVLGRIFRRAAHIVYRKMNEINIYRKTNHSRFLRDVSEEN